MKGELLKDIYSWDIYNWSQSLYFWETCIDLKNKKYKCLEIGAGQGGMSLWLALNGNNVLCTDRYDFIDNAKNIHKKYNITNSIDYKIMNALDIPFENEFDIVIVKSVIGGVGYDGQLGKTISQIYKSLKTGGCFLFVENLKGSKILMQLRKLFSPCGKEWNYLDYNSFSKKLEIFDEVKLERFGVFGVLGRNNFQQKILGKLDKYFLEKILPKNCFYIVAGIAFK